MGTANSDSGRLKTVNALYRNEMEVVGNRHSYMTVVEIKIPGTWLGVYGVQCAALRLSGCGDWQGAGAEESGASSVLVMLIEQLRYDWTAMV